MKNRHCSGRPGQVLLGHCRKLSNWHRLLTEASRDQGKHQPLCIAVRMVLYWCPRHLLCGIGVRVSDEASVLLLMVMPVAVVVIERQQHKGRLKSTSPCFMFLTTRINYKLVAKITNCRRYGHGVA